MARRKSLDVLDQEAREEAKRGENKKHFHVKDLRPLQPLTPAQKKVFTAYYSDFKALMLHGSAGTGKTAISVYLALSDVLEPSTPYDKLIIVRSPQQSKEQGFVSGDRTQKEAEYEPTYRALCDDLFEVRKSYDNLKKNGYIEFMTTSFARGITFNNAIVVYDETANATFQELDLIFTRTGQNCKTIFCGDVKQSDLGRRRNEVCGLPDFLRITGRMSSVASIEFKPKDCVRSGIVKEYLLAKEELGL